MVDNQNTLRQHQQMRLKMCALIVLLCIFVMLLVLLTVKFAASLWRLL